MTTPPDPNSFVDYTEFPFNVVLALETKIATLPGLNSTSVFKRPVRATDPPVSVGVVATLWKPNEYEMGSPNPAATISTYSFAIQSMIKHADEIDGLVAHSILSKRIRRMVDTDAATGVLLGQLRATDGVIIERTLRFQIVNQQFLSNEVQGSFVYVSVLELQLETETVNA